MTTLFGQIQAGQNLPIQPVTQRAPSPQEAIHRNNDKVAATIRVAIPAEVIDWNPEKMTITARPLIRERIVDRATGSLQWTEIPLIPDVPVAFPQAGGFALTFPIAEGDEVLLVFNDLQIDNWWASGGVQNWNDRRRHDLSDAIAIPGPCSVPQVIPDISSEATELRSKDGVTKVRVEAEKVQILQGDKRRIDMWEDEIGIYWDEALFKSIRINDEGIELRYGATSIVIDPIQISLNGVVTIGGHPYLSHKHADPVSGTTGPVIP